MKRNFFFYLSPSIIKGVIWLFIIVPLSTYYLDPKDFGIVAIITVFSNLITPLSSVGISWVLAANFYKISALERGELIFNLFFLGMMLRTFWLLIFAAAGHLVLPKFIQSYESTFLLFFWLFLLAEWFNFSWELTSFVIVLQKRAHWSAALDVTKILSQVVFLVICLQILRLKTISLVLMDCGEALAGFIFSVLYIRRYIVPRLRIRWLKEIVRVGFPTSLLNIFEVISNSIDRFFIERWIGLSQLGVYGHSLYYRKAFVLPQKAFSNSYSPEVLAIMHGKGEMTQQKAQDVLKKWFGLLMISGAGIILFSREIIGILTHGKFIAAAPLVSLWFLLILVYAFGVPYTYFLLGRKKNKFIFYSNIIIGILSWGGIAILVKFFGIIGATIAIVLYFFTLYLVNKIYSKKLGCENFDSPYFGIAISLLLSLVLLTYVFLLTMLLKIFMFILMVFIAFRYFGLSSYIFLFKERMKFAKV